MKGTRNKGLFAPLFLIVSLSLSLFFIYTALNRGVQHYFHLNPLQLLFLLLSFSVLVLPCLWVFSLTLTFSHSWTSENPHQLLCSQTSSFFKLRHFCSPSTFFFFFSFSSSSLFFTPLLLHSLYSSHKLPHILSFTLGSFVFTPFFHLVIVLFHKSLTLHPSPKIYLRNTPFSLTHTHIHSSTQTWFTQYTSSARLSITDATIGLIQVHHFCLAFAPKMISLRGWSVFRVVSFSNNGNECCEKEKEGTVNDIQLLCLVGFDQLDKLDREKGETVTNHRGRGWGRPTKKNNEDKEKEWTSQVERPISW